jgi:hypothetical protein
MSAAERQLVERSFNATDMAPSQLMHAEQSMHGAFEHWAATRPDAPALVYGVRGHLTSWHVIHASHGSSPGTAQQCRCRHHAAICAYRAGDDHELR